MCVAGACDGAPPCSGATRMLGGHEANKGHQGPRGREAAGITEFDGEDQGAEGVDTAETAQAGDAVLERGLGHERV